MRSSGRSPTQTFTKTWLLKTSIGIVAGCLVAAALRDTQTLGSTSWAEIGHARIAVKRRGRRGMAGWRPRVRRSAPFITNREVTGWVDYSRFAYMDTSVQERVARPDNGALGWRL